MQDLIAKASTAVDRPRRDVWQALIDPVTIKQYMFGAEVITDWQRGSAIVWKGEWRGRPYEDKGVILQIEPERILKYSHFSPLSGLPDSPENYHTVTVELSDEGRGTRVSLTQDHNPSEEAREHSAANWRLMLETLKELLEQ